MAFGKSAIINTLRAKPPGENATDQDLLRWQELQRSQGKDPYVNLTVDQRIRLGRLSGTPEDVIQKTFGQYLAKQRKESEFQELLDAQQKQFQDLTSSFRTQSEQAAARQVGGLLTTARQGLSLAGIEGPMAEALVLREQGRLAEAVALEQSKYVHDLQQLQAHYQNEFLQGSFDFFDAMAMAEFQQALDKDMLRLQMELQQNIQEREAFYNMLGDIGGLAVEAAPYALALL